MESGILNSLLKEYEQKKLKAELDLEERKKNLYVILPRLAQIDEELNMAAITTAKDILRNNKNSLSELKEKMDFLRKEKEEILKSCNINLDYLKPFYECKICNDTGYVFSENHKSVMCNCLKQRLLNIAFNNSNLSNLDKENFSTFRDDLFSDEVDLAKYKLNISPRKNMINIKNKCVEFVENFDNPDYKNLLFTGNTGLR